MHADRQTRRQTVTLITILRSHLPEAVYTRISVGIVSYQALLLKYCVECRWLGLWFVAADWRQWLVAAAVCCHASSVGLLLLPTRPGGGKSIASPHLDCFVINMSSYPPRSIFSAFVSASITQFTCVVGALVPRSIFNQARSIVAGRHIMGVTAARRRKLFRHRSVVDGQRQRPSAGYKARPQQRFCDVLVNTALNITFLGAGCANHT